MDEIDKLVKSGHSIEAISRRMELKEAQRELFSKGGKRQPEYGEVAGGIGWPTGAKPGEVVVVAEKGRNFYVIGHASAFEPPELLGKCVALSKKFGFRYFYCDINNRPMMDHVYRIKNRPNFTSSKLLDDPNELVGYVGIIRELTSSGSKRLFFHGDAGAVANRLYEVPLEKLHGQTQAFDYPLLQALGGCLSSMTKYKMTPEQEAEMERQIEMVDYLLDELHDEYQGE
jgi:hypothetical protein